jgi:hypothetical protein
MPHHRGYGTWLSVCASFNQSPPTSETFATSHSHTQRSIRDRRPSGRLAQARGAVADLPYSALALRAAAANASMVGYSRS